MRRPVFVLFLGFVCLGGMAVQSAPFTKAQLCQLIGNAEAADNGRSRQDLEGVTAHVTLRPPGQNWRIAVAEVTDPASQPLMQVRHATLHHPRLGFCVGMRAARLWQLRSLAPTSQK